MSQFEQYFGSVLLGKSGASVDTSALNGKVVGIYFSAHWCPPCRRFTPMFSKLYGELKAKGTDFEVVFVSSDKSEGEFQEYYSEMPWLALPYSERVRKSELSSQFSVNGIPTLVILDTDGSIITTSGTQCVGGDITGARFPWRPLPFAEELGTVFLHNSRGASEKVTSSPYIGLYFSAHWCPPCQQFTPKLKAFYEERKRAGHDDFEVVFCSSDREQHEFNDYFAVMPWYAMPFQDPREGGLSNRFEIEGIPALIIVDTQGNVITKDGVSSVMRDPRGTKFPFFPEPIVDLANSAESYGKSIDSKPSLVVFMEALDDGDQEAVKSALLPSAHTLARDKAQTSTGPDMLFFTATNPGGLSGKLRELCSLGTAEASDGAQMVILDIRKDGAFFVADAGDITAERVQAFIGAFKAGSLTRQQLPRGN